MLQKQFTCPFDNPRMTTDLAQPQLQFFADLSVRVDQPQDVGVTARGRRRLIPILGGEAVGDGITERMFVGSGARHPDKVVMRFWQLA